MPDLEGGDQPESKSLGDRMRSWAITGLGWFILAVIAFFLVNWLFDTLRYAFRALGVLLVIAGLTYLYFKLRRSSPK